jgi:hypothetical protein
VIQGVNKSVVGDLPTIMERLYRLSHVSEARRLFLQTVTDITTDYPMTNLSTDTDKEAEVKAT